MPSSKTRAVIYNAGIIFFINDSSKDTPMHVKVYDPTKNLAQAPKLQSKRGHVSSEGMQHIYWNCFQNSLVNHITKHLQFSSNLLSSINHVFLENNTYIRCCFNFGRNSYIIPDICMVSYKLMTITKSLCLNCRVKEAMCY